MSTTREAVTARMNARAAQMPTPALCEALGMLTTAQRRTPEEHLTRSVLIGVLCERHPEAGRHHRWNTKNMHEGEKQVWAATVK